MVYVGIRITPFRIVIFFLSTLVFLLRNQNNLSFSFAANVARVDNYWSASQLI